MNSSAMLAEAFRRIQELVHKATDGLSPADLTYRPEPGANSIGWLIWHLTRIQDDHVAEIAGRDQVWGDRSWAERTGIARGVAESGQGDGPDDVAALAPTSVAELVAFHDEVMGGTFEYLNSAADSDLDRIIDDSYDPPVTVGVRLVSVISDNIQHAGQARYLHGMIGRLR